MMSRSELTRSAGSLLGLCAVTAIGLTVSCFSERATGTGLTCTGTTCEVEIRDFSFQPQVLRVPSGATVTWVNRGQQVHTSTSDGSGWDSGGIAPGASYPRQFTGSGQFSYHCEPHPSMTATIIVE